MLTEWYNSLNKEWLHTSFTWAIWTCIILMVFMGYWVTIGLTLYDSSKDINSLDCYKMLYKSPTFYAIVAIISIGVGVFGYYSDYTQVYNKKTGKWDIVYDK